MIPRGTRIIAKGYYHEYLRQIYYTIVEKTSNGNYIVRNHNNGQTGLMCPGDFVVINYEPNGLLKQLL